VLNHVLLHQSVIGIESKLAMEKIGEYPDIVIAVPVVVPTWRSDECLHGR
jgi:predicted alternative tryptophan synthase beta-subunit